MNIAVAGTGYVGCVIGADLKAFAGSIRADEGQPYGSAEG